MATGEPVSILMVEFHREGRAAFLRDHPEPVLLLLPMPKSDPVEDNWTGFNTNTLPVGRFPDIAAWSDEEVAAASQVEGMHLVRISKSPTSPWRGRVSVGRARNTDIPLVDSSVSKLHAHFHLDNDGNVAIADAGSHNGTLLNGRRLAANEVLPLRGKERISIGAVAAIFHTPSTLCDFFTELLPPLSR